MGWLNISAGLLYLPHFLPILCKHLLCRPLICVKCAMGLQLIHILLIPQLLSFVATVHPSYRISGQLCKINHVCISEIANSLGNDLEFLKKTARHQKRTDRTLTLVPNLPSDPSSTAQVRLALCQTVLPIAYYF